MQNKTLIALLLSCSLAAVPMINYATDASADVAAATTDVAAAPATEHTQAATTHATTTHATTHSATHHATQAHIKPVNINTADAKTLATLKGVSKKTAKAIAAYRTKNGEFKSADDLLKVKGITKKILKHNKDSIKLADTTAAAPTTTTQDAPKN